MKRAALWALVAIAFCAAMTASADTFYVWTNSPADGPGTAWSNALRTIQGAVDVATKPADLVLVTNGVYDTGTTVTPGYSCSNRVVITNDITVRSVNGPEVTIIRGAEASSGGSAGSTLRNCIAYFNTAGRSGDNWTGLIPDISCSCTTPLPDGTGNITNDPQFVAAGDYHLRATSPCIDKGNNADMPVGPDLDGVPRPLDSDANGTAIVDMGCYEYLNAAADSDGDGLADGDEVSTHGTDPTDENTDDDLHTDGEESIADTDPTDPASYFCITAVSNSSPVIVFFESSSNRWYTMKGSSNLVEGMWANVPGAGSRKGVGGADWMWDTNQPPRGPFYRVGVTR